MAGRVVLFGATGYTGDLTARAMVRRGMRPVQPAQHRDQLVPTRKALCGVLAPVLVHRSIEIRTGNQSQDLSKQAGAT